MKKPAKTLRQLAPLLLTLALVTAAAGAFVAKYIFTTPSTVTVTINDYYATIYTDTELTTKLTTLDFGTYMAGDPSSNTKIHTPVMYLHIPNLADPDRAYAQWTCTNLPSEMTLTAKYDNNFTGELNPWDEDTLTGEIAPTENKLRVQFILDVEGAPEGVYSFDITIEIGVN